MTSPIFRLLAMLCLGWPVLVPAQSTSALLVKFPPTAALDPWAPVVQLGLEWRPPAQRWGLELNYGARADAVKGFK